MRAPRSRKSAGFVLLEALIALLIVSVGLLAISKLEGLTISAAGEARSRSEAVTLAQKKLEQLRNWVTEASFTAGMVTGTSTYSGTNADYNYAWTISAGAAGTLVQLTTTWTGLVGNPQCADPTKQCLDLNSLVTWDNLKNQVKSETGFAGINAPAPSGDAKRGDYTYRLNNDGSVKGTAQTGLPGNVHIYDNSTTGKTELLNSAGQVVLYLDKVGNTFQDFTTIRGRIYFDQNAGNNTLPSSANVRVRLSSEGECFYDNTANNMTAVTSGSNSYKYFEYICYVGSGWYGNVGITVDDSVNGNASNPTICTGDPAFNSGVSNGHLTSAHPVESATRTYRGFYGTPTNGLCPTCLSTGVEQGRTIPNDGTVVPGTYSSPNGANGGYHQYFLLTHLSGNNTSCNSKMTGGEFAGNAGKYYCISPDSNAADDVCPDVWPNFTVAGGGGTLNYNLTLNMTGQGSGAVSSSPAGITCDTTASCTTTTASFASGTVVTLTPSAPSGSNFVGWSGGGCSGTGTCVVTMSAAQTVTAQFDIAVTLYSLSVSTISISSGSGTITSGDGLIACTSTCSQNYSAGASVTLTATPAAGSTFTGWGGACSGTGTCSVSMSAVRNVTATFTGVPSSYTLTVAKSGTGSGSVTGTGISCGSSCSSSYTAGTVVVLTAAANSGNTFTGWAGACSGTGTCSVTMSAAKSVTATFYPNPCSTVITGTPKHTGKNAVIAPTGCVLGTADFTCTLSSTPGTTVTITNGPSSGNPSAASATVTLNCQNQTNVQLQ